MTIRIAGWLFLAALLVRGPAAAQDPDRGAIAFRDICAGCHRAEKMAKKYFPPTGDPATGTAQLLEILADHGSTSTPCDRDIAAYLAQLARDRQRANSSASILSVAHGGGHGLGCLEAEN